MRTPLLVIGVLVLWAAPTLAADVGVEAKKLIIQDTLDDADEAKLVYRSRDHSPISKGTGLDPALISAQFDVSYVNGATTGTFFMPAGANWFVNNERFGKYVNTQAPIGGGTKVGLIKVDGKLKVSGKGRGDVPMDIIGAGDPGPSGVLTVFTVDNAGEINRHCTLFTGCVYRLIHTTKAKVVCRNGTAAACP
jgi:hypothetical protein